MAPPVLRWVVVTRCLCVTLAAGTVVWVCCGQRMLKEASVVLRLEGCIQRRQEANQPAARVCGGGARVCGVASILGGSSQKSETPGPSTSVERERSQAFKRAECVEMSGTVQ